MDDENFLIKKNGEGFRINHFIQGEKGEKKFTTLAL